MEAMVSGKEDCLGSTVYARRRNFGVQTEALSPFGRLAPIRVTCDAAQPSERYTITYTSLPDHETL